MKKISILGSTGSIGKQTLDVVRENPDKFRVLGLTARRDHELLAKQALEFKPKKVAILNETGVSTHKRGHEDVL